MRKLYCKNLKNNITIDLGSNIDAISKVIEVGNYIPDLIYEILLNGKELKRFLVNFKLDKYINFSDVDDNDMFIITAYDW